MKTPTPKEIAAFIVKATKDMLQSKEDITYHLCLAENVSLVLAWEPGFDENDTDKYIDQNGYGLCWSFRQTASSYFVNDWDYLDEGGGSLMNEPDEKDGFLKFAEGLLEYHPEYLNPTVLITLPGGDERNILDDAYWVSQDDALRNEEKDLTQLWWYYHGWSWGGTDKKELEDEIRLWADHLADYYGISEHVQEAITFPDLSDLIYNALIKRV